MRYSACIPFSTTALVEMLRFELMVERGLCEAATTIVATEERTSELGTQD